MNGNQRRPGLLTLAVFAILGIVNAHALPIYKPDIPVFYQHQKSYQGEWPTDPPTGRPRAPDNPPDPLVPGYSNGSWWENTGGWCGVTAWANCFYNWDENGYPGLFDHSNQGPAHQNKNWLERFAYVNEDIAIRSNLGCPSPYSGVIPQYLQDHGYGPDKLTSAEYVWENGKVMKITATGLIDSGYNTMFDLYYDELIGCEDVVLWMEGTDSWWWSGSFHMVTGAGVEQDKGERKLWFADPDRGKDGETGWGHPYQDTDPIPVGQQYYTMATFGADGRTFATGPYAGASISHIQTLSPIPEASTYLLFGLGALGMLVWRKRKVR